MTRQAIYGAVSALALLAAAGQGFAAEPGDFQATKAGITIGLPLGAAPPPGLYAGYTSFIAPDAQGTGQNKGITVFGLIEAPALLWSPGWKFLGASVTSAVVQPYFQVAGCNTNAPPAGPGCLVGPPYLGATWFANMHNTILDPFRLSWNFGNGWFASTSVAVHIPDGSRFDGTLNQDYWTYEPNLALAYLSKDWKLTANFFYDIHTASAGHTGTYALVASTISNPVVAASVAAPGVGYVGGQQAFLDLAFLRKTEKWEFGPVAYFKWQTTDDRPGNGITCAQLAATPLPCGRTNVVGLGGLVGYDFGPLRLDVWATEDVSSQDDFKGFSVFTRMSFRLWGQEAPPSKRLITK